MTTKAHNAKVNADRGDMNLVKLIEKYGDDDRCRQFLEALRWPQGPWCPRCEGVKVSRIARRNQFDCDSCRYQFSVTSGTVFHDTHLPLWKWFLAVYLICESKKGISANQLKRTLAVSYKTAWYLCHRIRSAMIESVPTKLSGTVEADETYIGGRYRYPKRTDGLPSSVGRDWRANKAVVVGAIERDGKLRLRHVPNARKGHVHQFLDDVVAPDAEAIYTDALRSYQGIGDDDTRHEFVDHSADEWVRGDVHTNSIESAWSLFDRAVIGSYHKLSKKHLQAYLQEFEFRFNNRDNPYLFRDTLLALLTGETLTYSVLTNEVEGPADATQNARSPSHR